MTYETIVLVAPTTEPITLDEAKAQLRLDSDFTLDDVEISEMIKAARARVEKYCNRFFTTQTIKIVFYGSIGRLIKLPYSDLSAVSALTYVDTDGNDTAIDGADYSFSSDLSALFPVSSFPSDGIAYTVTAVTSAPIEYEGVKGAIKMIVSDLYENRDEHVIGGTIQINSAVESMLYPYRKNIGIK